MYQKNKENCILYFKKIISYDHICLLNVCWLATFKLSYLVEEDITTDILIIFYINEKDIY
jgi:hypothetical protein